MVKRKSKIYKVLLHVAGWLLFLSWPFLFDSYNPNRQPQSFSFCLPMIIGNGILLFLFYLNIFALIPKILHKLGWPLYLGSVMVCFFSYAFISNTLREQVYPRRSNNKDRDVAFNRRDSMVMHDANPCNAATLRCSVTSITDGKTFRNCVSLLSSILCPFYWFLGLVLLCQVTIFN